MNTDAIVAREWARVAVESAENAQPVSRGALAAARHVLATTTPPTMADVEWDDEVHAGLCAEHEALGLVRVLGKLPSGDIVVTTTTGNTWCSVPGGLTPIPGTKIDLTPRREPVSNEGAETGNEDRNEGVMTGNDAPKPRPQDVPVGEVWEVQAVGYGKWAGTRSNPGNTNSPWTLIRVDSCDYYWAKDGQVTLVRRLVPEAVHDHPTILSSVEDYDNAPTWTVIAYADDVAVKRRTGRWQWTGQSGTFWAEDLADADPCTVVRWGK